MAWRNWWRGVWAWLTGPARDADGTATAAHLSTGIWGEDAAAAELRRAGYRVIGRRVRVGRRDEIDIVAEHGGVLVFVEVKTRRTEVYGRPMASIDRRKRRALSRAAVRYVRRLKRGNVPFRFDAVEVVGSPDRGVRLIRLVENAFALDRRLVPPA